MNERRRRRLPRTAAQATAQTNLWAIALPRIRAAVGEQNFQTWIAPLQLENDPDALALAAPDARVSASVNRHFVPLIASIVADVSGRHWSVRVHVGQVEPAQAVASEGSPVHDEATFERFVTGDSNRDAHHHARAVADGRFHGPGPLVIHGGVGLGKTHLARAIANARRRRGSAPVVCEACTDFVDGLLAAVGGDRTAAWSAAVGASLLILDDVHFVAGQEAVQEALLQVFAELSKRGTTVVLTSDRPPAEIPDLQRGLRSRFENGVLTEIAAPEFDLRRRILLSKAADRGLVLTPEVAAFLADRITGSGRALEGALTRVSAYAMSHGRGSTPPSITRATASAALRAFEITRETTSLETIAAMVAQERGLATRALSSRQRTRDVTVARQLAMYLCRMFSGLPMTEIAARLGRRDHTTVLHACTAVRQRRAKDPSFDALVRRLEERIRARTR